MGQEKKGAKILLKLSTEVTFNKILQQWYLGVAEFHGTLSNTLFAR